MNQTNSLLAKLNKGKAPAAPAAPSGAPPTPGAMTLPTMPTMPTLPTTGNSLLARLQSAGAPSATVIAPGAVTPPSLALVTPPVNANPVNPPEWQPPPAASLVPPVVSTEGEPPLPPWADPSKPDPRAPPHPPPPALPVAEAPAKRGRKTNAEKAAAAASDAKIGVLYLNCGPTDGRVVDANIFIQAAKKTVATTQVDDGRGNKSYVSDYRFAPFGQGPGMLALAVANAVDHAEPDVAQAALALGVRLDTSTPEGSIVAVEMTARAARVVR
jgi:hypothetical protein